MVLRHPIEQRIYDMSSAMKYARAHELNIDDGGGNINVYGFLYILCTILSSEPSRKQCVTKRLREEHVE